MGKRIEKNVNGTIIQYLYDQESIIAEYDQSGNITAKYTHGLSLDEPLAVKKNADIYYYHADGLGSIVALTDAAGAVVETYSYDSFGKMTKTGDIKQPFTYTAREFDQETGLYYYRARYYDAKAGRFLQRDPIGFDGGDVNLYAYVGNNPVDKYDSLGLAHCTLIFSNDKGRLTCVPDNPANQPVDIPVASGNNRGGSKCKNNPDCDDRPDTGPIPAGDWIWTNDPSSKPNGRVLEPLPGKDTHGRLNIQSHSCDNAFGPSKKPPFCSAGCVTGQAGDIRQLNKLIDAEPGSTLHVGE